MIVQAMPYPGGFTSATITVASGKVASDQTDFPVLLNLADMPSSFWAAVASDGGNIRIKQSGSVIPFDVVAINVGAQTGTLYLKAANLYTATANVFTLDLTGGALLSSSDTNGRNNVWTKFNRALVFAGNDASDRCGSGVTATIGGNAAVSGGKLNFDGSNDYFYLPASASTSFSILARGIYLGIGGSNQGVASYMATWSTSPVRSSLLRRDTDGSGQWSNWNTTNAYLQTAIVPADGSTFSLGLTHAGGGSRIIYVDGTSAASATGAASLSMGVSPVLALGAEDLSQLEELKGSISVALFATSVLPADFIAGWHSSHNAPGSFYAIS